MLKSLVSIYVNNNDEDLNMTKNEAIKALDNGCTLTHTYFTSSEWVRGIGAGMYQFEDGVTCSAAEFWCARHESIGFGKGWSEYV